MIKIYHNPGCSKSCKALAILEQYCHAHDVRLEIIRYLDKPPAKEALGALLALLDAPVQAIIRQNEEEYQAMGLSQADAETVLQAVTTHPHLLQRPIVVYRDKAVIARPPELLHEFLQ